MRNYSRAVAVTTSAVVRDRGTIYSGFALRETSGTVAAIVRIYDHGSAASGTLLETVKLSAGESAREYYADGIWADNGLYFSVVSGAIEGSVRVG